MSKRSRAHLGEHKYERVVWGKKGSAIYKCMLPGCPHFIQEVLAVNRVSQCWGTCGGNVLISNIDVMRHRWHPMCDKCRADREERRASLIALGKLAEAEELGAA